MLIHLLIAVLLWMSHCAETCSSVCVSFTAVPSAHPTCSPTIYLVSYLTLHLSASLILITGGECSQEFVNEKNCFCIWNSVNIFNLTFSTRAVPLDSWLEAVSQSFLNTCPTDVFIRNLYYDFTLKKQGEGWPEIINGREGSLVCQMPLRNYREGKERRETSHTHVELTSLVLLPRLSAYSYKDERLRWKGCENPSRMDNLVFLSFHLTSHYQVSTIH